MNEAILFSAWKVSFSFVGASTMLIIGMIPSRTNSHQIRLGMDYSLTEDHLLSLVYTTAFTDSKHYSIATGAQNSVTDSQGDSQLHNAKLDYQTPFGLKAEVAFTSYHSPGSQLLYSTMGTETMNFLG